MQYLTKILIAIKKDKKLFQNLEINFILNLTTSQVNEVNNKRPEINLEYLKPLRNSQGEFEDNLNYKTPSTVSK